MTFEAGRVKSKEKVHCLLGINLFALPHAPPCPTEGLDHPDFMVAFCAKPPAEFAPLPNPLENLQKLRAGGGAGRARLTPALSLASANSLTKPFLLLSEKFHLFLFPPWSSTASRTDVLLCLSDHQIFLTNVRRRTSTENNKNSMRWGLLGYFCIERGSFSERRRQHLTTDGLTGDGFL